MYLFLFGLSVLDELFYTGNVFRYRNYYYGYHGVSFNALAYLWFGYALFVLGYIIDAGRNIARALPLNIFSFVRWKAYFIIFVIFITSVGITIWIGIQYGFGRMAFLKSSVKQLDPNLSYLTIVGDLSLLAYSLSIWRFMMSKRQDGPQISQGERHFLWSFIVPVLVIILFVTGSRSKIGYFLFTTFLAYHYGYRRLRSKSIILAGFIVFGLVNPLVSFLRSPDMARAVIGSFSQGLEWAWNMVMQRTTALNSFTIIFEKLDTAPKPEPLWMTFTSVIPRIVWPNKPFSDLGFRFSSWASNNPYAMLVPSLPGDFLIRFGKFGGLLAMFVLGLLWRIAFSVFIGYKKQPLASGFIYIFILPLSLKAIENDFAVEYGTLLRFLVVGLLIFWWVYKPHHR